MSRPFCVWKDAYVIGGPEISHPLDCLVYVVDADDLVLIDAGAGQSYPALVDHLRFLGLDPEKLRYAIVTHRHIDHIGALAQFKKHFGVELIAHEADAEAIETGRDTGAGIYGVPYETCPVEHKIKGGEAALMLGTREFHFVHIPGHTPGSMAVYLDMGGKRLLFGQDIHGPYLPQWGGDPKIAAGSLERLLSLEADILAEGHFGIFQPADAVREYIQGYLKQLKAS
ncbi:MAG: MBL fold metallo-hydrolase [Chloroflexi bacterium]|nr:MBL fold metallo-hydrolase [Chloroflexota bacterium]